MHRYIRDNAHLAWRAVSAIEQGDAQELGRAMTAAQVRCEMMKYIERRRGGLLLSAAHFVLISWKEKRFFQVSTLVAAVVFVCLEYHHQH